MSEAPNHDPRMRGFRSRSSVESGQALIDARVKSLGAESVPLAEASGRVLAGSIVAGRDVPSFDRAAMDGYALRGCETFGADGYTPTAFRLVGRSRPGTPYNGQIGPGEAVAIATGAPMPARSDAVVKVESCRLEGDLVLVIEPTPPLRHVGLRGEDVKAGASVLSPDRVLRPQDLGILSALGRSDVTVARRPIVAILITGEELLPAGAPAVGCRLADMNGPMLSALVTRDGGIARIVGPLADDRNVIRQALIDAVSTSDFVIVSGGSSTGPEDHAPSLVGEIGELAIHGLALRPASPTGLGFVGSVPVLLAPGNPVSCLCAYDFFGGRIVRLLGGRPPDWTYRSLDLPLAHKLVSTLGRVDYSRVRIVGGAVVPIATSGASILSSTTEADGFVIVPASAEGCGPGEVVRVWLYDMGGTACPASRTNSST